MHTLSLNNKLLITAFTFFLLLSFTLHAEHYEMKKGSGSFSVTAPAKTITGQSNEVKVSLDTETGRLNLEVPVKSFRFSNNFVSETMNDLIYDRFNQYYMESDLHPKVTYQAMITNKAALNFKQDGIYPIQTKGIVTIHGVQQEVTAAGSLIVKDGQLTVSAKMTVEPTRYKIHIPSYIGNMYFKEVIIDVSGALLR